MNNHFRIYVVITGILVIISLIGGVTAVSLTPGWQEHPADERDNRQDSGNDAIDDHSNDKPDEENDI